ncbi:MAG TPA: cytochrome c biogenesis protein CcdA [Thermoanaerobaculia bacterium]|nr:cytochrome c biogenesis protein CcdA [Thermoanaerobaculia bacterium]
MKRAAAIVAGLCIAALSLAEAPKPNEIVTVAARVVPASASSASLRIDAQIAASFHVNSHRPSEDYLIPTSVALSLPAGVTAGEPKYPAGAMKKFSFSEKPLSVYEGRFSIEVPLTGTAPAAAPISGKLNFQACNDTQCYAPASIDFRAEPASAAVSGGAVPLSQAPPGATGGQTGAAGASLDFEQQLSRRGLPVVLALLFVGGLALNLTPCVYPVIPLTLSFFAGQAQGQNRRVFRLALVYVLGMATTYSALGVAAALSGRLFGSALQSPWVLGGVALVLVALALSMFGFYDLRMPSFLMQKAGARSGVAGAYAMGLLVGVVAAPCVGPFVLGLLAFVAARQQAGLGFLFFFVLSLGLGLPYLFLGAFSGSLARLPRAGMWMESVKKIFGWVLLAMAAYFLRPALPGRSGDWILCAVLAVAAVALIVRSGGLRPALRFAAAVLFLAAAAFFFPRKTGAAGPAWEPYPASAAAVAGRPAVIEFGAAWCVPCRELDEKTFADARVRDALSRRRLYKADLTKTGSAEVAELSDRYAILGVPTIVFLDAAGKERADLRLVGFEGPDAFLARLAKAP